MPGLSVILHPTDLSDCSMAAFGMACRLAGEGTRLVVLHVMNDPLVNRDDYLGTLNRRLRELESPRPGVAIEIHLVEGHAVEEILHAAEDLRCDVIVMGSHGQTSLRERLTGGVSEAVLRRSRCPVLLVKSAALRDATPGRPRGEDKKRHVHVF